jgi:hypothetical protein
MAFAPPVCFVKELRPFWLCKKLKRTVEVPLSHLRVERPASPRRSGAGLLARGKRYMLPVTDNIKRYTGPVTLNHMCYTCRVTDKVEPDEMPELQ